ncbi:semaphorin-5A-like [Babylonia areolata]|uniref:semaphorin-5A-like n=1 Tax=Babylonia areolata TaxID=304850 RepID=UPI003FD2DB42
MDRLVTYSAIAIFFFCCCIQGTWQQKEEAQWTLWTQWSVCSKSCGSGMQTRTRKYGSITFTDSIGCSFKICPVNGSWSQWGMWGECSKGCGVGQRQRHRDCTNPPPAYDGSPCKGDKYDEAVCNEDPCPPTPAFFDMSQCNNRTNFTCANARMCVPLRQRCDQVAHCSDGSDEVGCRRQRNRLGRVRFNGAPSHHSSSGILAVLAVLVSTCFVQLFIGEQRQQVDQSAF